MPHLHNTKLANNITISPKFVYKIKAILKVNTVVTWDTYKKAQAIKLTYLLGAHKLVIRL